MSEELNQSQEQPAEQVTPAAEAPVVDKREELWGSKFASLTRKEREILAKEREIKERSSELERYSNLKAGAKERVSDVLAEYGLTVEDIVNHSLQGFEAEQEASTPEGMYKKLEAKLLKMEQDKQNELTLKEQQEEKRVQQHIEETISTFKNSINSFLEERSEDYELIAAQEASDTIFEVIEEYYNQNGEILSIKDAANLVEEHLQSEATKIWSKAKKLQASLTGLKDPSQVQVVNKETGNPQQKKVVAPTLTNDVASTTASVVQEKPQSREQSLAMAAKRLKWNK